jgi:hypothetical protein
VGAECAVTDDRVVARFGSASAAGSLDVFDELILSDLFLEDILSSDGDGIIDAELAEWEAILSSVVA